VLLDLEDHPSVLGKHMNTLFECSASTQLMALFAGFPVKETVPLIFAGFVVWVVAKYRGK
jgi:hypothetical protein